MAVRNGKTFTRVNWPPCAGRALRAWPVYTIAGGESVFEQGRIRPGVPGKPPVFTQ
jgi:dihydroorotase